MTIARRGEPTARSGRAPRPCASPGRPSAALLGLVLGWLVLTVTAQLVAAAPAAAHAELLSTDPHDGARLARPPTQVTLRFSEPVTVPDGGFRLVGAHGAVLPTRPPVEAGSTVRWTMPRLAHGSYRVDWRVVSDDGHPVSGSLSFGVDVRPVPGHGTVVGVLSWPVTAARLGGYLGFVLVAGVVGLVLLCWPEGRREHRTRTLLRVGLVLGAVSTVAALLLQGPYSAGQPLTRVFDRFLMTEVVHTPFGAWTELRILVFLLLGAVLWPAASLESRVTRWIAGTGVVAAAATYSGTGHAAGTGGIGGIGARAVDSVHVLAAGVWVGGLLALVVASTSRSARPTRVAFTAFSRVALLAVLALVTTGLVNSLLRLGAVPQLWRTGYGELLSLKLALVALALGAAALSRRRLNRGSEPWASVRVEAVATLFVLAVTAVLASTAPPAPSPTSTAGSPHAPHRP